VSANKAEVGSIGIILDRAQSEGAVDELRFEEQRWIMLCILGKAADYTGFCGMECYPEECLMGQANMLDHT
jgi:hypothetical protein